MCVCVCLRVRVRVRLCVHVGVCVRARVCVYVQHGHKPSIFSHTDGSLASSSPPQIKPGSRSRRLEALAAALEESAPPKKTRAKSRETSGLSASGRPASGAEELPSARLSGTRIQEVSIEADSLSLSKAPPAAVLWIDKLLPKPVGERQVQKDHICRTLQRRKVEIDALFWHHSAQPQDVAKGATATGEVHLDRIKARLMSEKEFVELAGRVLQVSTKPSTAALAWYVSTQTPLL